MFYSTANDKAVAGARIKLLTSTADLQVAGNDVNNLFVRMAVGSADPALFHAMLGKKELVVISTDATGEARLGT